MGRPFHKTPAGSGVCEVQEVDSQPGRLSGRMRDHPFDHRSVLREHHAHELRRIDTEQWRMTENLKGATRMWGNLNGVTRGPDGRIGGPDGTTRGSDEGYERTLIWLYMNKLHSDTEPMRGCRRKRRIYYTIDMSKHQRKWDEKLTF